MAKMKREIDKDLMYKKLMPSNLKAARNAAPPAEAKEPKVPSAPEESEIASEAPNPPRAAAARDVALPSIDSHPTVLVNRMESLVLERLDSVLAKMQCCKCDRCKKDIVALALNKLPPQYTVLTKGQLLPDVDRQTTAQVLSAMIQAVLQVRKHPRH